jgi:hypothetical protein
MIDETHLIENWQFCDGSHFQDGIPELNVPNGWRLRYTNGEPIPESSPPILGQRPEVVPAAIWDLPEKFKLSPPNPRDYNTVLKVHKWGAPFSFELVQEISGLQVGAIYHLRGYVFPDFYNKDGTPPAHNSYAAAAGLMLDGETEWFWQLPWDEWSVIEREFEATAETVEIGLAGLGKWGLAGNTWWLHGARLFRLEPGPPAPPPVDPPPVEPPPPPVEPPPVEPPTPIQDASIRLEVDFSDEMKALLQQLLDALAARPFEGSGGLLLGAAADHGVIEFGGEIPVEGESAYHRFKARLTLTDLSPKMPEPYPPQPGPDGLPLIERLRLPMAALEKAWYEAAHDPRFGPYNVHPEFAFDWNLETGGNTDLGEPLVAPIAGLVTAAADFGGRWGRIVQLAGWLPGEGVIVWMGAHLQEIAVEVGQTVAPGDPLGTIGTAGGQYAAHLHEQWCQAHSRMEIPPATAYPTNPAYAWLNVEAWYRRWLGDDLDRFIYNDGQ